MSTLYSILIVFEAIVCFLLIGIVLLQKSTGDGNGLSFGSGAESVFGAQAGNVLTRGTVVLAVLFLLNTLVLCVLRPQARAKSIDSELAEEQAKAAAAAVPESSEAADLLDTVEQNVEGVAGAVEQNAEAAAETVEQKAEAAAEAVEKKVDAAADAVETKAEAAAEAVEQKAEAAAEAVEKTVETAVEAVEKKAE